MLFISFLSLITVDEDISTLTITISGDGAILPADISKVGFINEINIVKILTGVTEIGDKVFQGRDKIHTVNLPPGLSKIGDYCFDGCFALNNIEFPSSLSSIGSYAFRSCHLNKIITFGSSFSAMNDFAFKDTKLLGMVFENTVSLSIGQFVVEGVITWTEPLKLITPMTLTVHSFLGTTYPSLVIGPDVDFTRNPFPDNLNLKTITLQSSNTRFSIDKNVIYSNDFSELIVCPAGLTGDLYVIDPRTSLVVADAFRKTQYKSVDFSNVIEIGATAFFPSSLTSVIFRKVTKIGMRCFENSKIVELNLPETLEEIDSVAFSTMSTLTKVTIPLKLSKFGTAIFTGCKNLLTVDISENHGYLTKQSDGIILNKARTVFFYVPPTLTVATIPTEMLSIGYAAFRELTALEIVTIHQEVNYIDAEAFRMTGIKTMVIPKLVTFVSGWCYHGCYQLESVIFPPGSLCTRIDGMAFNSCSSLRSIDFGDAQIETIGDSAFGRIAVTSFTFPTSFTSIGFSGMSGNSNLETIHLRGGDVTIEYNTFEGTLNVKTIIVDSQTVNGFRNFGNLETIHIKSNLKIIKSETFSNCKKLKTIIFDDNSILEEIGSNGFSYCELISSISLPGTIREDGITASVFTGCSNLLEVSVKNEFKFLTIEGSLYSSNIEKLIICPAGKTEIRVNPTTKILGDYSLSGCLKLKNVYLSVNLNTISKFCFYKCESLEVLNIPANIKNIGETPFLECKSLKLMTFCGKTDQYITTFNDLNPIPNQVIFYVSIFYQKETFKGKEILRTTSNDEFGCPIPPTHIFTKQRKDKMSTLFSVIYKCVYFSIYFKF